MLLSLKIIIQLLLKKTKQFLWQYHTSIEMAFIIFSKKMEKRFENQMIVLFNQLMNAVGKCDLDLNYNFVGRKYFQQQKKVSTRMINLCLINLMILLFHQRSCFYHAKTFTMKSFFDILAYNLAQLLYDVKSNLYYQNTYVLVFRLKGNYFSELTNSKQ